MRIIDAYQAVDGKIFLNEKEATKHDLDCIGAEFDALLLIAMRGDKRGTVTRSTQFNLCIQLLNDREEARQVINKLYNYLNNEENEND